MGGHILQRVTGVHAENVDTEDAGFRVCKRGSASAILIVSVPVPARGPRCAQLRVESVVLERGVPQGRGRPGYNAGSGIQTRPDGRLRVLVESRGS